MATNEGLKIRIGATIDQLQKDLKTLKADFAGLGKEVDKEGKSAAAAGKQFEQLGKSVSGLSGKQLPELKNSASNTGAKMAALNNIVRDAPYGINGVANNITQLADAMFGASAAAASVTFGISLLVTGAVALSQKYGSLGAAIEAVFGNLTAAEKAQKLLSAAQQEGIRNAQEELVHLNTLYQASQNVNIPIKERSKIIGELQSQYPQYFGSLSREAILAGNAAVAYSKLRDAIIAKAKSAAIEGQLVEQQKAYNDLSIKIREAGKLMGEFEEKRKEIEKKGGFGSSSAITSLNQAISALNTNIVSYRNQQKEIDEESKVLANAQQTLIEKFGAQTVEIKEQTKAVKKLSAHYDELQLSQLGTRQDIFQRPEPLKFKQSIDISLDPANIKAQQEKMTNALRQITVDPLESARIDMQAGLAMLNAELTQLTQNLALDAVTSVGDAIGAAIVGNGSAVQNAMRSFVTLLGDYFQNVGKQLIVYSGVLRGVQIAIEQLNPTAAAIAGAAALIAGGALKAYASKIPSFATGGGVFGAPTMAMIGDNPGREEYVIPSEVLDKLGGRGGYPSEIILRAYGTDLVGVLKMGNLQTGRING